MLAHEVAFILHQRLVRRYPSRKIYKLLDEYRRPGIGTANHRRHHDGGMPGQCVFNFGRSDAIAGTGDDVVGAPVEPEIAVFITTCEVAGDQPAVREFTPRRLGVLPVFEHHYRIRTAES